MHVTTFSLSPTLAHLMEVVHLLAQAGDLRSPEMQTVNTYIQTLEQKNKPKISTIDISTIDSPFYIHTHRLNNKNVLPLHPMRLVYDKKTN